MLTAISDWETLFERAVEVYTKARFGLATLSLIERENSAAEFVDSIELFRVGGLPALTILETFLHSHDAYRRNTAARILIELSARDSLRAIGESMFNQTDYPILLDENLRRLWKIVPPSGITIDKILFPKGTIHYALLEALLDQPTSEAYKLVQTVLESKTYPILIESAIKTASKWNDPKLLWSIVDGDLLQKSQHGDDELLSFRMLAAFHLGQRGHSGAISFLEASANKVNFLEAAHACKYLAYLALPSAITPIESLLLSDKLDSIQLAIEAAADLRSGMLVPALLALADQRRRLNLPSELRDNALQAVRYILGANEISDEAYLFGKIPEKFSEDYRHRAIIRYEKQIANLNLTSRYHYGEPLTLHHLTDELLNPHTEIAEVAAYNLLAITGQDYDFDPNDDIIANLPAIYAWRKYIATVDNFLPGGWAFMGKPLPSPSLDI